MGNRDILTIETPLAESIKKAELKVGDLFLHKPANSEDRWLFRVTDYEKVGHCWEFVPSKCRAEDKYYRGGYICGDYGLFCSVCGKEWIGDKGEKMTPKIIKENSYVIGKLGSDFYPVVAIAQSIMGGKDRIIVGYDEGDKFNPGRYIVYFGKNDTFEVNSLVWRILKELPDPSSDREKEALDNLNVRIRIFKV